MDFFENLRATRQQNQEEAARVAKQKEDDKNAISDYREKSAQFLDDYSAWANRDGSQSKAKGKDRGYYERGLDDFIRKSGEYEGRISADSSEADIARYGSELLDNLRKRNEMIETDSFDDYVSKVGTDEEKALLKAMQDYDSVLRAFNNGAADREYFARETAKFKDATERYGGREAYDELKKKYESRVSAAADDMYDLYENYEKYMGSGDTGAASNNSSSENEGQAEAEGDTVTFTLPRANDPEYGGFAQKIIDLGLATDKGLWGSDGDVEFYTKQLYDQGALDENGNLKIGVPIKLKRRKV